MKTIAVANQKGGCGKTTTSVNLSAALAKKGYRVLIIDLDPQAHATLGLGAIPEHQSRTVYDTLRGDPVPFSTIIIRTVIQGLDIAPSNILLSGTEAELSKLNNREYTLEGQLKTISHNYDYCVIDCSPSLSVLTLNALVAAKGVVIPVQTHYYAIEGLRQLMETIDIVRERFNPGLNIAGVLLTFVDPKTRLSRDVQRQLREHFNELIFDTVIHRNVRLAEAPSAGESVITYDVNSKGAVEYLALADEVTNGKAKRWTA
jgi:chromosome partitioning protein